MPRTAKVFAPDVSCRLSRRQFVRAAAAASLVAGWCGRLRAAPAAHIEEVRTISLASYYHGWPTVARRNDGTLLLVYSGGREAHVCPFGRVELMRSYDEGRTWTWPQVLLDSPIDDRDAGICITAKGTLLVTTFTSLAYVSQLEKASGWPEEKLQRWLLAHRRVGDSERQAELATWMIRSEDGGLTWSARYACPVNSPHGPVTLRDGRILYAGKDLWGGSHRVGVCQSIDDGKSWQWLAELPVRKGDDRRDYHELHLVETESGKLIIHIRNHNRQNEREILQSESTDGGKTWSEPHPIGVWGLPSHLLRLADGRLLMSYGYRRPPYGVQVRISEDEGAHWSEPIVLSDDGTSGDLGYPSTVECGGGRLVTVWYELRSGSPYAVLRQATWKLVS
ncbi:MAG: hypothetical protein KatS3mg110_0849 [Pirellulaceae bacterium]|nr:MAG: hypothetical protein KatS3mg110_0849 [Pirellulaceae bacterium]